MTAKYVRNDFVLLRSQVQHLLQFSTVGEKVMTGDSLDRSIKKYQRHGKLEF